MKYHIQTKMITLSLLTIVTSSLTLSGCASMGSNEATGTVLGGVTGAAIGGAVSHNAAGAGIGAVAGGLVGNAVGRGADNNSYNDY